MCASVVVASIINMASHWELVRQQAFCSMCFIFNIHFFAICRHVVTLYISLLPVNHSDIDISSNVQSICRNPERPSAAYTCMGAKDKIFDHCFPLSSCATAPLSLVPMGSPALLLSTQALSSKRPEGAPW